MFDLTLCCHSVEILSFSTKVFLFPFSTEPHKVQWINQITGSLPDKKWNYFLWHCYELKQWPVPGGSSTSCLGGFMLRGNSKVCYELEQHRRKLFRTSVLSKACVPLFQPLAGGIVQTAFNSLKKDLKIDDPFDAMCC